MNWDAIGTIAEVVSAAAVVVSLIYLAAQIKQNTKQVEEQARGQRFVALGTLGEQWRGFRSQVTNSPEVASIWRRGNEDFEGLDEDSRALCDLLMVELIWSFAYNWMMGVEDGLGEYVRDDIADNFVNYDTPGLGQWWRTSPRKQEYPRDFVDFLDGLIAAERNREQE